MSDYSLIEVDRAGNAYEILIHDDFSFLCEQAILAKRARPTHVYNIICPERVDVDCWDGLTDDEREMLP